MRQIPERIVNMLTYNEWHALLFERVKAISKGSFDQELALEVFRFQAVHNHLYKQYLDLLSIRPDQVNSIDEIPFLPIRFFKSHIIKTGKWEEEDYFTSSGTGSSGQSRHSVRSVSNYINASKAIFEENYGSLESFCFLGLLPSYLERDGSSLIVMVDSFIKASKYQESGFYLKNTEELYEHLIKLQAAKIPTVLLGVSFALMDFAERYELDWNDLIVMETGGMKGKRKEITRDELHQFLSSKFHCKSIHSEYGMTELLSQAYSQKEGLFNSPSSMHILVRERNDPFSDRVIGRTGQLNIVDLNNLDTIAFLETEDLAKVYSDGSFEVLGRMDTADLRGCNLLLEEMVNQ